MSAMIHSKAFQQALIDAGVIRTEDRVRRVVIDVQVGEAVKLYVERYGDERLLDVVPALTGVSIQSAAAPTDCPFVHAEVAASSIDPTDARCVRRYGHEGPHEPYRDYAARTREVTR